MLRPETSASTTAVETLPGYPAGHAVAPNLLDYSAFRSSFSWDAARRELDRWSRGRKFVDALYLPAPQFRIPAGDTIVCRCEEVTAGDVRQAVSDGARLATEVRAATRCGMGLCQGRLCMPTVAGLIERYASTPAASAGRLTARPPVRPLPVTALADEV